MTRLTRATAFLTLLAILSLNGAGIALAYADANVGAGQTCSKTCCNLSKSGQGYAASCCAVRCGEDVGERGSEPARERISFGNFLAVAADQPTLLLSAGSSEAKSLRMSEAALSPGEGQPEINIKNSVFLI